MTGQLYALATLPCGMSPHCIGACMDMVAKRTAMDENQVIQHKTVTSVTEISSTSNKILL